MLVIGPAEQRNPLSIRLKDKTDSHKDAQQSYQGSTASPITQTNEVQGELPNGAWGTVEDSLQGVCLRPIYASLSCRHNQWLPRTGCPSYTCHKCNGIVHDEMYYCPKCPAQVCPSCFRATQPTDGYGATPSTIFGSRSFQP